MNTFTKAEWPVERSKEKEPDSPKNDLTKKRILPTVRDEALTATGPEKDDSSAQQNLKQRVFQTSEDQSSPAKDISVLPAKVQVS